MPSGGKAGGCFAVRDFEYEKKRKKFSECFLQVPLRNDRIEVILRLL
jgi:hypothetical protein